MVADGARKLEASMSNLSNALPQHRGGAFLADGGLETTLVFLEGIDLPSFAAFPLVLSEAGRETLTHYFAPYLAEAKRRGVGFVLDTPTWRANPDWAEKLGFGLEDLLEANRRAVAFAAELRNKAGAPSIPIVLNGVIGPRGRVTLLARP